MNKSPSLLPFAGPLLFIVFVIPTLIATIDAPGLPMSMEEVSELLLIPVLFLFLYTLYKTHAKNGVITNLAIVALVVMVQGMIINQVGNYLYNVLPSELQSSFSDTVYFYDETLGHILATSGYLAFWVILTTQAVYSVTNLTRFHILTHTLSAVIAGITLFLVAVESQTIPILICVASLILGFLAWGLRREVLKPWKYGDGLALFMMVKFGLALLLVIGWGIAHGGAFPEFSELGWI